MNYNNIPKSMQGLNQWVCYKSYLQNDGKYKKVIKSPITKDLAYCNNSATWTDFESAKAYCIKYKMQGLAFALTKDIVFVDIDHAIDKNSGEITSNEAIKLLKKLPNTFTERSVSGTGIHILFKGNLPPNCLKRNDKKGIEMYDSRRFICMTGDIISESIALADYSDIVENINHSFIGVREEATYMSKPCTLSDNELVQKIMESRQGAKFQRLYSGNTNGYESHSNADFAFASILAWWTQDFHQIDRIFQSSGLMRSKYNRRIGNSTYGKNLIAAALNRQNSSFTLKNACTEMS